MSRSRRVPAYGHNKATGQACVVIDGKPAISACTAQMSPRPAIASSSMHGEPSTRRAAYPENADPKLANDTDQLIPQWEYKAVQRVNISEKEVPRRVNEAAKGGWEFFLTDDEWHYYCRPATASNNRRPAGLESHRE